MINTQEVLNLYHHLYDNIAYQTLVEAIAHDLQIERDSLKVVMLMNAVTDASLELVGHPNHAGAWLRLAIVCYHEGLSLDAINSTCGYLRRFQRLSQSDSGDFEDLAKCLLESRTTLEGVNRATAHANGIRGWRGRMAYHLLAATAYFLQTSIHLLMESDLSYLREKLQNGIQQVLYALQEGIQNAETPATFDFHTVDLPDPDAGNV